MPAPQDICHNETGPYEDDEAIVQDLANLLKAIQRAALDPESGIPIQDIFGYLADGQDEPLSEDEGDGEDIGMAAGAEHPVESQTRIQQPDDDIPIVDAQELRVAAAQPARGPAVAIGGSSKDKRAHIRTADMSDEKWANTRDKKWRAQNRKMLKKACLNIHKVSELDLQSLVTGEDQHRSSKPYPDFGKSIPLDAKEPLMLVDRNGIPAVVVLPGWLGNKAHDHLFERLMRFGREIEVDIKKAADKKTRDTLDSYTRRKHKGELHGVFQLVTLWRAIGRNAETAEAGPARDVLDSITKFNNCLKLLKQLYLVSARLDDCFKRLDPDQHEQLSNAAEKLKAKYPSYAAVAGADPTFLHGRSIIWNRETPDHNDRKDHKLAWTPLITVGRYTKGTLHVAGRDIGYMPGSLVFIRGGVLKHRVSFAGGQRVAIAHFMHKETLAEVGVKAFRLLHHEEILRNVTKCSD